MDKPLQTLHKALREQNYDVPENYDDFEYTLSLPGDAGYQNRHSLWQSLKDNNFDVPDNYDDFRETLFNSKETKQQPTVKAKNGYIYSAAGLDSLEQGYKPEYVESKEQPQPTEPIDLSRPQEFEIPKPFAQYQQEMQQQATDPRLSQQWAQQQAEAQEQIVNPTKPFGERVDDIQRANMAEVARQQNRQQFDQSNFEPFFEKHVAGVFGEERQAGEQRAQEEIANIPQDKGGGLLSKAIHAVKSDIATERHTDPEKITNATLQRVQDDDAFGDYVLSRMGINGQSGNDDGDSPQLSEREKEYMKQLFAKETGEVTNQIINRIYDNYKREGAPQSTLDYIAGKAFHENMVASLYDAMVRRVAGSSGMRQQLRAMAYQEYGDQAGWLTQVAGGAAPFAVDMLAGGFALPNAVGQAVVKGGMRLAAKQVAKEMEKRAVARGLEGAALKEAVNGASGIAERYIATNAPIVNIALRTAGGAANFATYDTQSELIRQIGNGKFRPFDLMKEAAHGALLGGAMGVTGGLIGRATQGGTLAQKVAGDVAAVASETGIFAAANGIQKAIDQGIDITDVDWADTTGEALGMVVGMKATGAVMHPKQLLNRYRNSKDLGLQLNQHDIDELKAHGYDFDGIFKGLGKFGEIAPQEPQTVKRTATEYTANPDGTGRKRNTTVEEVTVDTEAYDKIMSNPELSSSVKRKLAYIVTGKVLSLEPTFGATLDVDDNGKATITTLNAYGNIIDTKEYDNTDEARKEYQALQEVARTNTIGGLERIADKAGFPDVLDEAKGRTKEETGIDVDDMEQLSSVSEEKANEVLDTYQKNLQEAYMQRFNGKMEQIDAMGKARAEEGPQEAIDRTERRQEAYDRGATVAEDESLVPQLSYESKLAEARIMQMMPDGEQSGTIRSQVMQAMQSGDVESAEAILQRNAPYLTPQQREAMEQWMDTFEIDNGVTDAVNNMIAQYEEEQREKLSAISDEQGNITKLQLKDGSIAYYKSGDMNRPMSNVFVTTEDGRTIQISSNDIVSAEPTVSAEDMLADNVQQYDQWIKSHYSELATGQWVNDGQEADISMGGQIFHVVKLGYDEAGNNIFQMPDGSRMAMSTEQTAEAIAAADDIKIQQQLAQEMQEENQRKQAERFGKGIVGYNEGTPDVMAKDTKPEVAAEYLLSHTDEQGQPIDRKVVLDGIQKNVDDLNIAKQQALQALQTANNNLVMADEGEVDALRQQAEQLEAQVADLNAQYRKWGEIRQAMMNDEERQAYEKDRIKAINKAREQSQKDVQPSEETVTIPTVKELMEQYAERSDAEAFVEEQRKQLSHLYQQDLYPQYDDIQKQLEDYRHGLTDLAPDEIKALTDQQAMLSGEISRAVEASKKWQQLVPQLSRSYAARESQNMTPHERAMNALAKETNKQKKVELAKKAFADDPMALNVLDNMEPQDVNEWIAANLGAGSINWEGLQRGEHYVRGLRDEMGKDKTRGIGAGFDTNAFNTFLAPEGQGKGIEEVVHDIAESSPYDTQEVKNALLAMLQQATKPTDISHYIENNRIAQAEDIYEKNLEHERELEEEAKRQAEDDAIREMTGMEPEEYDAFMADLEQRLAEQEGYQNSEEYFKQIEEYDRRNEGNAGGSQAESPVVVQGQEGKQAGAEAEGQGGAGEADAKLAEQHLQAINDGVAQYQEKYRTLAPLEVIDINSDDSLRSIAGDDFEDLRKYLKDSKLPAAYDTENKKIYIFAGNLKPEQVEEAIFHENIHRGLQQYYGDGLREVSEAFWNTVSPTNPDGTARRKAAIQEEYKNETEEDQHEEYLVNAFAHQMTTGSVDNLFPRLSAEHQEIINNILHNIGYDRAKEATQRRSQQDGNGENQKEISPSVQNNEQPGGGVIDDARLAQLREKHPDYTFIIHDGPKEGEGTWQARGKDAELIAQLTGADLQTDENGIPYLDFADNEDVNETLRVLIANKHKAAFVEPTKQQEKKPKLKITETVQEPVSDVTETEDDGALRDIIQLDDDNYSKEEQKRLKYIEGESFEEYAKRNHSNVYDAEMARLYLQQKYADRLDEIADIMGNLTLDNVAEAGKKIAEMVDSRDEGYSMQMLLRNIPVETILPFNDAVSEAFDKKIFDSQDASFPARLAKAKADTNVNPTEDQKKAGNYKMGHISFGGYDMSIENPKGSTRSGVDANGKPWSIEMKDTYGYIREKYGTDKDHLDFFINDDADLDNWNGRVYVVDQKNEDGTFDEHKVMYGYPTFAEAKKAYLRNYEDGWWEKHVMSMTGVRKEKFDKWLESSDYKTKPFAEYSVVKDSDPVSSNVDQLMADIEDRKKVPGVAEEEPKVTVKGVLNEVDLKRKKPDDLKQLRKKENQDRAMAKMILGTTDAVKGTDKERTLQENIIRAEANMATIDKVLAEKQAEAKKRYEQQEIGFAMVDQLENMGFEVSTDTKENRRVLKQAEKDNSEAGKLHHYRTSDGKIYGFSYKGKIYLDPTKIDAELPMHEYGHPWCEAFRRLNPEGWKNIVDLMKADKDTWEFIKSLNPDLESEDDLAEEMITKCSGERGAEYARKEFERMNGKGNWGNIWKNISKAIQDFWKAVGDFLHIKYESAEQVYDQVIRDFANKVNPRKRVEDWLKERDEAYMDAVAMGDNEQAAAIFDEALREHIGNGITPFIAVDAYKPLRKLAHEVKTRDPKVIAKAADLMAPLIPKDAVLVPAPSHTGKATDMLDLANAISERTGAPVADVLTSGERGSQYEAKYAGKPIASSEMGITLTGELPEGLIPVVIDNVVDTGNTAEACVQALGKGIVASLADSAESYKHVASLKSAEPIVTDRNGNVVPLSKRFELKGKYLERAGKSEKAEAEPQRTEQPTADTVLKEVERRKDVVNDQKKAEDAVKQYLSRKPKNEEEQVKQRATKAVLKAMEKAGVPYKVVSKEEEKQMLQIFSMMNQEPIKELARKLRNSVGDPHGKSAKYIIYNMADPFGVPMYFEKLSTAKYALKGLRQMAPEATWQILDIGYPDEAVEEPGVARKAADMNVGDLQADIEVWHGSGARFDAFDHKHMGEGEGNRVYGWGTYVTEVPEVGKLYANTASHGGWTYKGEGRDNFDVRIADKEAPEGRYNSDERLISLVLGKLERGYSFDETIRSFVEYTQKAIDDTEDEKYLKGFKEQKAFLESLKEEDFERSPRYLYKVDIPDDTGKNYLYGFEEVSKTELKRIYNLLAEEVTKDEPADSVYRKELKKELESLLDIPTDGNGVYGNIQAYIGSDKETSKFLHDLGYVGIKYPVDSMNDGERSGGKFNYVIFNEDDAKIVQTISFMWGDEQEPHPIFVSNALNAVEGIKQEKATPEQWLAMIQKNGGLKAGEDKWLGLSDWLKEQKGSVTKQDVLDYIRKNQIQVEEVPYQEYVDVDDNPKMQEFREEYEQSYDKYDKERNAVNDEMERFNQEMYEKYGQGWANDISKLSDEDRKRYGDITKRYDFLNDNDIEQLAFADMVENYGDNFSMAFEVNYGNGKLEPQMDMYGDDISDAAKSFLELTVQPINSTRLSYTTEGLENKREIALTVHNIEPWNVDDQIHFGDADEGRAVAWIRFGDTRIGYGSSKNNQVSKSRMDAYYKYLVDKYGEELDPLEFTDQLTPEESAEMRRLEAEYDKTFGEGTKKVLVIDEIQSKRHQSGREQGYRDSSKIKELEERYDKLVKEEQEITEREKAILDEFSNEPYDVIYRRNQELQSLSDRWRSVVRSKQAVRNEITYEKNNGVPDAPFDKNWHELAMKRMLRYAAENGYDKIAWTTGAQQADRYNLRNVVNRIDVSNWGDDINGGKLDIELGYKGPSSYVPKNDVEKAIKEYIEYCMSKGESFALSAAYAHNQITDAPNESVGWTHEIVDKVVDAIEDDLTRSKEARGVLLDIKDGDLIDITVDKEGKVVDSSETSFVGKPLSDVVGKDMALKIVGMEGKGEISADGLSIGGEGMKGFYDEMLVRFMNKYGKKWGVKVEKIDLPSIDQTMWSIDVTPEMKESVMQGQPMFQKEGKKLLGWSDGKQVYLTKDGLNPNTPLHETTHLWDNWCMKEHPDLWKKLVEAMKQTAMWEEISKNPNYRNIWNDENRMASEVHARLSGAAGEDEFMKAAFKKDTPQSIINQVKSALKKFWDAVLRLFGKHSKTVGSDWDDLRAIIRMPIRDLVNQDFEKVMKVADAEAQGHVEAHIEDNPETVKKLDKEPKEVGYRNVVVNEDGTLGSPMANRLGKKGEERKATTPFEYGKWERSDEHPELANENGKIDLIKPDGKSVGGVDYNPYIHIRPNKVNKQFKQAWERPNLVYVETEYPTSELNGEYHAEKAALPTGKHPWGGGELILSRWDKPLRMVPWEEVADDWVKEFKGTEGIHFDIIPPKLLPILAERGMTILPPHKGMGKDCFAAYEAWKAEQKSDKENAKVIFDAVKNLFGTTHDIREAGYVLPDGSMPDFSGRHQVDKPSIAAGLRGRRTVDHRDIEQIAYEKDGNTKTGLETTMPEFIRSGAIRIDYEGGNINLATKPTDKQRAALRQLILHNDGYVQVDFGDGWDSDHYVEYDGAKVSRVLSDIDRYFDEGIKPQGDEGLMRSHRMPNIEKANAAFNNRLEELDKDRTQKNRVLKLGKPGMFLLAGGVKNGEIVMDFDRFVKKSNENYKHDHPYTANDIKDLPKAVNAPIAVFDSTSNDDKVILTELTKDGKNFVVVIRATEQHRKGGVVLEVNEIQTLFPKKAKGIVKWFMDGLFTNVDKNKALSWIEALQTHPGTTINSKELDSAAKVIKDFENPKLSEENLRNIYVENVDAAEQTAEMLGGQKIVFEAEAPEEGTLGWYDPNDNTVHVVLPEQADVAETVRTVFHEKLGHEGLVALLGSQEAVNKFGSFVFHSAKNDVRKRIMDKAEEIDPEWRDGARYSKAAQEVLAEIAEEGRKTEDEFDLWTKVKHYLIRFLNKIGLRVRGLLNDKDLAYYIVKTGKALQRNISPDLSKQATEQDILRSRGGKPRQRRGENMAQYFQRLREWEKWKLARQTALDNGDPEPEESQFQERAEAKYREDMAEWRRENGLPEGASSEAGTFPIRRDGESPQEFAIRVQEYEARRDLLATAPQYMDYMRKANEDYRRAYTEWRERYDLEEQMSVDQRLYEGDVPVEPTFTDADEEVHAAAERDLADEAGFEIDERGAKRMAKLAVIERRKDFESANAEDAIWVYDFMKMTDSVADEIKQRTGQDVTGKEIREALPFLIEADRRRENMEAEKEEAVQAINMSSAIQQAHSFMDFRNLEQIGEEVNALQQAWEYQENHPSGDAQQAYREAAARLADKLNELNKDYAGYNKLFADDIMQIRSLLVHATVAGGGEVMPPSAQRFADMPEMKPLMEHIKAWYDEFFQLLEDTGLRGDAGYIEDGYVNHVWDKEKSDPKAWEQYIENRQRTKSPNMRHREIDTYMDGIKIGLVPKYTDIADMIAHYSRQNNEAVANRRFLDALKFVYVQEMNSEGEVTAVLPLLMVDKPDGLLRDRYAQYYVPGVGDVYVMKHIKNRFANVFGTMRTQDVNKWVSDFGKGYDIVSATAKKIQLALSGFHALALFEVDVAQNNPAVALKHLLKYIIADGLKKDNKYPWGFSETKPAYAHPEDFQLAAKHLVQLGATEDYAAADVNAITANIREYFKALQKYDNVFAKAAGVVGSPAAIFMDWINKGFDTVLWNYLHDGLKLCAFKELAKQIDRRVAKEGLDEKMREQLLDEAGQYVNDMFGGQYWELINVSPADLKLMRRFLLSPDWLISTQRHFFANFGFGSVYSDGGFREYIKYNTDNIQRLLGKDIPHDELRRLRSKNAKYCYLIGALVWWNIFYNAINALMRWLDEKDEKKKAEEMRKTNPEYKSPYELVYPNGMKWYDYTMWGNAIGQQTHLFTGRYADGTETYVRWGKQFREFPELFMGRHGIEFPAPLIQRMMSKANPNIGTAIDFLGAQNIGGFNGSYENKELREKYGKTIATLASTSRHFIPFGMPTQTEKEYKWLDFFMPSSKGFSRWKAKDYFETFIMDGDWNGIDATYNACVMNGIDAEKALDAAIASIKATQKKELAGDVTDLTTAAQKFDEATTPERRAVLLNKLKKHLKDTDYKVMTKQDARDKVQAFLDGDAANENARYLMLVNSEDVIAEEHLKDLGRKAKQYIKKVNDAPDNEQEALENRYAVWYDINDIVNEATKDIREMKKLLGGMDDKQLIKDIRQTIRDAQKEIDELEAPK